MAFQNQLRKLMNQNGKKAADLARATGLSEAAISDYLNGKKEPRGRQSVALAKALNTSLDTLWETDFQIEQNIVPSHILSESEQNLISGFRLLNDAGKQKVLSYIKDLADTGNYTDTVQNKDNENKNYQYKFSVAARNLALISQTIETDLSLEEMRKLNDEAAVSRDDKIF